MFNKGNSNGLIASIPIGGHWAPNSIVGAKALWKNAQNIAKKNKASDTINKPTPIFSPLWTANVWFPKYVPSDITSRNQNDIEEITDINANIKKYSAILKACINSTPVVVKANNDIEVYIGQGDGDTKWNGWAWKFFLIKIFINLIIFYINSTWLNIIFILVVYIYCDIKYRQFNLYFIFFVLLL